MIEKIAFVLMVGYWVLAAIVVLLRLGFPKAAITRKFIEYLANVTVSGNVTMPRKDDANSVDRHTTYRSVA